MPTKSEYRGYIASPEWQSRRSKFLATHRYCCDCGIPRRWAVHFYDQDLHVHHESYAHVGAELDEDLRSLCRRCHEIKTFGHSSLPKCWHSDPAAQFLFTLFSTFEAELSKEYVKACKPYLQFASKLSPLVLDLVFAEVVRSFTHIPSPETLITIVQASGIYLNSYIHETKSETTRSREETEG
jgi:hypothetical protein